MPAIAHLHVSIAKKYYKTAVQGKYAFCLNLYKSWLVY